MYGACVVNSTPMRSDILRTTYPQTNMFSHSLHLNSKLADLVMNAHPSSLQKMGERQATNCSNMVFYFFCLCSLVKNKTQENLFVK